METTILSVLRDEVLADSLFVEPCQIIPEQTHALTLASTTNAREYIRLSRESCDVELITRTIYVGEETHECGGCHHETKRIDRDGELRGIRIGQEHDANAGKLHRALKNIAVDALASLRVPRIVPNVCWMSEQNDFGTPRADFAFWDHMYDGWFGEVITTPATLSPIKDRLRTLWLLFVVEKGSASARAAIRALRRGRASGIMFINTKPDRLTAQPFIVSYNHSSKPEVYAIRSRNGRIEPCGGIDDSEFFSPNDL